MPFIKLDPVSAAVAPYTTLGDPTFDNGKTFGVLKEELRVALGGRTDADDRIPGWVNDAYLDLVTSLKLDEHRGSLELSLVADQPLYNLPPVVGTVLYVSLMTPGGIREGYPLEKTSLSAYRSMAAQAGDSSMYFRWNQMLAVWPTPDVARTAILDFRLVPIELEDDDECPMLGRDFHEGIKLLARQKAFSDLLEFDKAMVAENEYTRFIRRRKDREADEDEGRTVGSSVPTKIGAIRNTTYQSYSDSERY